MQSSQEPSVLKHGVLTVQLLDNSSSSSATTSNLPGPSRVLGNALSYLGIKLEKRINWFADKLGHGPLAYRRKLLKGNKDFWTVFVDMTDQWKEIIEKLMGYIR